MQFVQSSLSVLLVLLALLCHENKFHRWKANAAISAFQPTIFDNEKWRVVFHLYRNVTMMMAGRTGLKTTGKFLQPKISDRVPFPCDVTLGRSPEPPTSVHKLRPGKQPPYGVANRSEKLHFQTQGLDWPFLFRYFFAFCSKLTFRVSCRRLPFGTWPALVRMQMAEQLPAAVLGHAQSVTHYRDAY